MRELNLVETFWVSGGMQAAESSSGSDPSYWQRFLDWVDWMWGGGSGGGSGPSQSDIQNACFGVGVAGAIGGNLTGGGRFSMEELCDGAASRVQQLNNKSQDAMCDSGVGQNCP